MPAGPSSSVNNLWPSLLSSCLENPRDRGVWWAAVYGVAQSRTQLKRLSSSRSSSSSSHCCRRARACAHRSLCRGCKNARLPEQGSRGTHPCLRVEKAAGGNGGLVVRRRAQVFLLHLVSQILQEPGGESCGRLTHRVASSHRANPHLITLEDSDR